MRLSINELREPVHSKQSISISNSCVLFFANISTTKNFIETSFLECKFSMVYEFYNSTKQF